MVEGRGGDPREDGQRVGVGVVGRQQVGRVQLLVEKKLLEAGLGHGRKQFVGVGNNKKGLFLVVPRLDMLNIILRIEQKQHFLVGGNLVVLLVDEAELPSINHFHNQHHREDDDEDSNDEAEAEADVGDVADLGQSLVVLIF